MATSRYTVKGIHLRNFIKIIACIFILTFISFAQESTNTINVDPVQSFKEYIKNYFESYKSDKRERITKLGGGWVKECYEPDYDYKIDVQKTNSLITPFMGICEFTLIRRITNFHKNLEDTESDSLFVKSDKRTHIHNYGFQERKWIVTSRKSQDPVLAELVNPITKSATLNKWYDCNEVIKFGELKGTSNIHGCWEIGEH